MLIIPLSAVPAQVLTVQLANQAAQLRVYQKTTGLYIDVYVNNALIIGGVICRNLNRIVRSLYLGFVGDLTFIDNMGTSDPEFAGLGDRYSLAYLETTDPVG